MSTQIERANRRPMKVKDIKLYLATDAINVAFAAKRASFVQIKERILVNTHI